MATYDSAVRIERRHIYPSFAVPPDDRRSPTTPDPLADIAAHYNQVSAEPTETARFLDKYAEGYFSVEKGNLQDRTQTPNTPPRFQSGSRGDYLALRLGAPGRFAVVPRFNLPFNVAHYGPGAMAEVFACVGYKRSTSAMRPRVIRPAIFTCDGERVWTLLEQGTLSFSTVHAAQ